MTMPSNSEIWSPLETLPPLEIFRQSTRDHLDRQLARVMVDSPFYRRKFAGIRLHRGPLEPEALHDLPFTEKSELLEDQAAHPPFGSNLCLDAAALRRIHKTSGTTGRPLIVAYAKEDIEITREAGARCFWSCGLRPGHTVFHCLNFCMWAGGLTDHLSLEATGAAVVPFGVGNSKNLIETMFLLRPTAIHCTPSYLAKLELLLDEEFGAKPTDLGLQLGLFGAEAGLEDPNYRAGLERTWGFRAMNANYGMSDVLSMFGAECRERDGLHFMGQGIVLPEIVEPISGAVLPLEAGTEGELVLTNLTKRSQPLIRYRSRDLVRVVSTSPCACGRHGFRFRVIGRSDDMLVVKGINVFPATIAAAVARHLDRLTGEYLVRVDRENPIRRLVVCLELRSGNIIVPAEAAAMAADIEEYLYIRPELELVPYGGLPRTEGKSKRLARDL